MSLNRRKVFTGLIATTAVAALPSVVISTIPALIMPSYAYIPRGVLSGRWVCRRVVLENTPRGIRTATITFEDIS